MKRLLLFCILFSSYSFGQFNYEWTIHTPASTGDEWGRSVTVDQSGNVIYTACYYDTIDLDPGPGVQQEISAGFFDTYVQKLDPNGNLIWYSIFTGTLSVVANEVVTDDQDNVYLTGSFRGTVDFDPGPGVYNLTALGPRDAYVVKLANDGSFVWAKHIGDDAYERSFGLATDSEYSVYISGYFGDTVDFDPGPGVDNRICGGLADGFVLKLDSQGDYQWAVTYPNDTISFAITLDTDPADNIIVGGYFAHVMDFDPGAGVYNLASNGGNDQFLQKLTKDGDFVWAISVGDVNNQTVRSIETDTDGNIYLTGGFEDTLDFDPSTGTDIQPNMGESDIYIQKYNNMGEHQWVRTYGSQYSEAGRNLVVDTLGYVYVLGSYADTIDFDFGPGSHVLTADTVANIFVLKLGQNGDFSWCESFGQEHYEGGYGIETDNNGSIYFTGFFEDTMDFDPGAPVDEYYSGGGLDIFLTKLTQCIPTFSSLDVSACNSYTSPSGSYTWSMTGSYMDTMFNACGADSIISIDLTISMLDNSVTQVDEITLFANENGATYQWVDCDNGYAAIAGETSQNFVATTNGNYAVVVSSIDCTDTSACMSISTVGMDDLSKAEIVVYPNPTGGKVTVETSDSFTGVIRIQDAQGRVIQKTYVIDQHIVDLELEGSPGYYVISLEDNGGQMNRIKLIKE